MIRKNKKKDIQKKILITTIIKKIKIKYLDIECISNMFDNKNIKVPRNFWTYLKTNKRKKKRSFSMKTKCIGESDHNRIPRIKRVMSFSSEKKCRFAIFLSKRNTQCKHDTNKIMKQTQDPSERFEIVKLLEILLIIDIVAVLAEESEICRWSIFLLIKSIERKLYDLYIRILRCSIYLTIYLRK